MQTRKVILLLFSLSLIFATFCGCGAKAPIELSESEITMEMYDEVTLTPQLKGYSMSDIMWRSSDSTVAKVRGGVVNSLKVGNAVITAKVGDATASVNVSVTRNKVGRALMVDKNSLDLEVGQSEKITASFKESGKILTVPVLFESSNPKIAEVNGDGVVSAIKRGNVIVSAYVNYKGQRHYRDVEVRSKIISYRAGEIGFINTVAATADGSSIAAYAGNVADLGFNVDAKILDANLKAGKNSAVWFKGENSERLVFNVKFKNALNGNIYMHLGGYKKQITVSPDLVSGDNSILFYGANGKIASTLSTSEVYTVVIDLTKSGEGKMFGLEFGADSSLYISEALLCTYDYYKDTYVHEQPPEIPELGFIYAETLSGLNVGGEEIDGFDKY